MKLTAEQRNKILTISREAQAFLGSNLYKELENWVKTEQALTAAAIVTNKREKNEENLTRADFVERKSSYYLSIVTLLEVIKRYSRQEKELLQIEENEKSKSKGN
jgi:nitrogenase subunit NifH